MSHFMVGAKDFRIKEGNQVCFRCRGKGQMYNEGMSSVYSGGKLADCIMCLGEGQIKMLDAELKEQLMKSEVKTRRRRVKPEHIEQANTL